jgi:arsenate reductase (thioredoxin)
MTNGTRRPLVLFVCTGNSARSQMAEAYLRKYAGDRYEAASAGLEPSRVHPLTTQVMNEVGVDISGQYSKRVAEFLGQVPVHTVVTVCDRAEARCPTIWPGATQRLSWSFDDPAACRGSDEERLEKFREVRDQIEERIKQWLLEQPLE